MHLRIPAFVLVMIGWFSLSSSAAENLVVKTPSRAAINRIEQAIAAATPGPMLDYVRQNLPSLRERHAELAKSASTLAARPEFKSHALSPKEESNIRALVDRHNGRVAAFLNEAKSVATLAEALRQNDLAAASKEAETLLSSVAARKQSLEEMRAREVAQLRASLARIPDVQESLAAWAALPAQAQKEVEHKAKAVAFTVLWVKMFTTVNGVLDDSILGRQGELKAMESKYFGLNPSPELREAYVNTLQDLRRFQGYRLSAEQFQSLPTLIKLSSELAKKAVAEAAMDAFLLYANNPAIDLISADVDLYLALGYRHVAGRLASQAVDSLVNTAEAELRTQDAYAKQLVQHTRQITLLSAQERALRAAIRNK